MKVAVFCQSYQNNETSVTTLLKTLNKHKFKIHIEANFYKTLLPHFDFQTIYTSIKSFSALDNSFDLLISIGGDGTILRAITHVKDLAIPIIGINTGRLGFLATIQPNHIETAIETIVNGNYKISERTLASIETQPEYSELNELNFALNEIAVSRKNTTSMITVTTHINGEHLTSYWADGFIISTPTGSTGYSLSCGGPVISPDTNSFVLTPIAPHNLSARPLVIPDDAEIRLKIDGREDQYLISLDSRITTLSNSTIVIVKKAPFKIRMIELTGESFINTLRKKLLWGEDKRN